MGKIAEFISKEILWITASMLLIGRGGEEFLLIFRGLNGDDAYVKTFAIRDEIKNITVPNGDVSISVTMTYGLSEYSLHHTMEENILEIDEKLYMGKESGRDRIIY